MTAINRAVEKYEKLILEAERRIWSTPETGFREVKSSAYLADRFRELGYSLTMAGDIPGFYTVVDTGKEGPEVLVLGELDSVICRSHRRKIRIGLHDLKPTAPAVLPTVPKVGGSNGVLDVLSCAQLGNGACGISKCQIGAATLAKHEEISVLVHSKK